MKVMIVVTHLLGTGHLARALTLSRAFAAAGHDPVCVSGGMPVPHLDTAGVTLVQLPPVRSNGTDFTQLLNDEGVVGDAGMAVRKAALIAALETTAPDLLITELFPFGRRILRDEFKALLEAAKRRNIPCLSSIRDILAPPSKPAKAAWAEQMIADYYAAVLVHSVPEIAPLSLSWPVTPDLAQRLVYTGFVAPAAPAPLALDAATEEVLVSAGGGDVGARIFDTAIDAAAQAPSRQWRLLVPGGPAAVEALKKRASGNCIVEATRPDFRALLQGAAVSVSMCGYNTALDLLQTGTRAVIIPFDAGGEVEQTLRSQALGKQDGIETLKDAELTPSSLLTAIAATQKAPPRAPMTQGMSGAQETVKACERILEGLYER